MKNLSIFTFILFSTLILSSCENELSHYSTKSKNDFSELYNNILDIDNLNQQLYVANSLSATEKYNLWQLKLNNFLFENDLNNDQIDFIKKLKDIIKPDLFIDKNNREAFNENFKNRLLDESKQLFGNELGTYLLRKFENSNQTLAKLDKKSKSISKTGFAPVSACDCSGDSECTRLTGISIFGLSWEYGECGGDDCYRESTHFLGFTLWESSDNGMCEY